MSSHLHAKGCRVFIGNIPFESEVEDLTGIFATVGPVVELRLVRDKKTQKHKGIGFCEYRDASTALAAIRNLHNMKLGARNLRVDWADNELRTKEGLNRVMGVAQDGVGNRLAMLKEKEQSERAPVNSQDMGVLSELAQIIGQISPAEMTYVIGVTQKMMVDNPEKFKGFLKDNPLLSHALLHGAHMVGLTTETALTHDVLPEAIPEKVEDAMKKRIPDIRAEIFGEEFQPIKKLHKAAAQIGAQLSQMGEEARMQYLQNLTAEEVSYLPDEYQIQAAALRAKTV